MLIAPLDLDDGSFEKFDPWKGHIIGSLDQIPRYQQANMLIKETSLGRCLRVLKIIFNKNDGSVHIEIPDYINEKGIFGVYNKEREDACPDKDVFFKDCAWFSDFMPKYSHHPDGVCTLSREDRVLTVKNSSVPLDANGINDLCCIYIHDTTKFSTFKMKEAYNKQGVYGSTLLSPVASGDDGRMYRVSWMHRDLLDGKVVYDRIDRSTPIGFFADYGGFLYDKSDDYFKNHFYRCHLFSPPIQQKYKDYVLAVGLEHQYMLKNVFSEFNRLEESVIIRGGYTPLKPYWLEAIFPFDKVLIDENKLPSRNYEK